MIKFKSITLLKDTHYKNLLFNVFGKGIVVFFSFFFTPYFIKLLGIEYYGLISFSITLLTLLTLLDLGLNQLIIREVTKNQLGSLDETLKFVRNFEMLYWFSGAVISGIFFSLSPLIASHWIKSDVIDQSLIIYCLSLLALTFFFQWPTLFYSGVLLSTTHHMSLNVTLIGVSIVKNLGLLALFYFVSPNIKVYCWWQVFCNALQITIFIFLTFRHFPYRIEDLKINIKYLKKLKGALSCIMAISITGLLLTQIDKIILSTTISLKTYGCYCLAATAASSLQVIAGAFFQTYFPKFSKLHSYNDKKLLSENYIRVSKQLSLCIIPLGLFMIFFSGELIYLWTKNREISDKTEVLLRFLTISSMLNALMMTPYTLQISHGMFKPIFLQNAISIFILSPLIYFLSTAYGPLGAIFCVILLNIGYVCINVQIMHKSILTEDKRNWYVINSIPLVILLPLFYLFKNVLFFKLKMGIAGLVIAFLLGCTLFFYFYTKYTKKIVTKASHV